MMSGSQIVTELGYVSMVTMFVRLSNVYQSQDQTHRDSI